MPRAPEEAEAIRDMLDKVYPGTPLLPVGRNALLKHLQEGCEVLHFVGHGVYHERDPAATGWQCIDETFLSTADIHNVSTDAVFPLLIFANACLSAKATVSAAEDYVGDLYHAFRSQGVAYYIGSLIEVPDETSSAFAKAFYTHLTTGATVGEALREARCQFLKTGSPIWACYVLYGSPAVGLQSMRRTWELRRSAEEHALRHVVDKVELRIRECQPKILVGRATALTTIDTFLGRNDNGVLLITGHAGFGKSALLAHWTKAQANSRRFVAYHVFSNRDRDLQRLDLAYRNLLRQLFVHFQITRERIPIEETLAAEKLWSLVRNGSRGEEPLVIVLDALDEAEGPFRAPLPGELGKGIYVIASARADPGEKPEYLQTWAPHAEFFNLRYLKGEAIKEWLARSECHELGQLSTDDAFVAQLAQTTEGFPLYLHFLIEELVRSARAGEAVWSVLSRVPQGFTAYVEQQTDLLAKEVQRPEFRTFLALLTVTLGPIPDRDVITLTGLREWDLRNLPWHVIRWATVEYAKPRRLYSFAHGLLAKEFESSLPLEAEDVRNALLDHCAQWKDHRSSYVLRHYAEHLWLANRTAKQYKPLYELVTEPEFCTAQREVFPNEPQLPLQSLRVALTAAVDADNAEMMAKLLLEHAQYAREALRENPLMALRENREGGIHRAWALADLEEPERRVLWHLLLAWELQESSLSSDSRATLERIFHRKVPRFREGGAAEWAAVLISRLEGPDKEVFGTLYDRLLTDRNRLSLCRHLCTASKRLPAEEVTRHIQDDWFRKQALEAIAGDTAVYGYACWYYTDRYRWEPDRQQALNLVATNRTLDEDEEEVEFGYNSLFAIARSQARAGDFPEAQRTLALACQAAQQGTLHYRRRTALGAIASVQAEIGNGQGARTTFSLALGTPLPIYTEELQSEVEEVLVETKARGKGFEVALDVAKSVSSKLHRVRALVTIAEAQAEEDARTASQGTLASALEVAEQIRYGEDKVRALTAVAKMQAKIGEMETARALFEKAVEAVEQPSDWWLEALADIAEAQASVGDVSAFQTAEGLNLDWCNLRAMIRNFMNARPSEKDVERAIDILRTFANDARLEVLLATADIRRRTGAEEATRTALADALQTAEEIQNPAEKALALARIAEIHDVAGEVPVARSLLARAHQAAQDTKSRDEWVQASLGYWKGRALAMQNEADETQDIKNREERMRERLRAEIDHERVRALVGIATIEAKIEGRDAVRSTFAEALKAAQSEVDRVVIAEAMADIGEVQPALQIAVEIQDESDRASLLAAIAKAQVRARSWSEAVRTAELILVERSRHLPLVAQWLVNAGDNHWKDLLASCAYSPDAAYRMCAVIARAYPDQIDAIVQAVQQFSVAS